MFELEEGTPMPERCAVSFDNMPGALIVEKSGRVSYFATVNADDYNAERKVSKRQQTALLAFILVPSFGYLSHPDLFEPDGTFIPLSDAAMNAAQHAARRIVNGATELHLPTKLTPAAREEIESNRPRFVAAVRNRVKLLRRMAADETPGGPPRLTGGE